MSIIHQIALTQIPGIGQVLARNLVSYAGGVEEVFQLKKTRLLQIPGIGLKLADSILNFKHFKAAELEAQFVEKHAIEAMFYLDKNYPDRLKHLPDAPIMLYSLGNLNLNTQKIVGIVGTRKATESGKYVTEQIVEALKPTGALIISGLALGIDAIAHRAAINQSLPTVGVLAHGLDRLYPTQHKTLAKQMLKNGGLLTDFISGTNPDRENFPKRNRIVAGLCDVLVVVETGVKGGAMITAEIANSYNKEIVAVPGRWSDEVSFGCNALIKLNKANMLLNADDLLDVMGWQNTGKSKVKQTSLLLNLTDTELEVVNFIRNKTKAGIDDVAYALELDAGNLSLLLLNLEFQGIIRQLPGKFYEIV